MLTFDKLVVDQGNFRMTADFTLPAGLTAMIGPSGSGKSTLLAAAAGFLTPTSGQITWNGQDLVSLHPGRRPISMLFQDNNVFPHLTVAQNVGLGIRPNLRLQAADWNQVSSALDQVGLTGMADRKPAALSGGQQSRVALARVLVANRPLVFLDEPFSALGPRMREEMLTLVQKELAGVATSILMVTHNPEDARSFADHVVLVSDGTVDQPRPAKETFDAPPEMLRDYMGTGQK